MSQPTSQREDIVETIIEYAMAESSREPDGERLWIKTSYELADILRPILLKHLAQAKLTWQGEVRGEILELYRKKYRHFTRDYKKEDQFRDDILSLPILNKEDKNV